MKMTFPQLMELFLCNVEAISNREMYEAVEIILDTCQDRATILKLGKLIREEADYEKAPVS